MDGSKIDDSQYAQAAPILIVATTTNIDSLDEALRRPGRFDREIDIRKKHQYIELNSRFNRANIFDLKYLT